MKLTPIQKLDTVLKIMQPPYGHEATTFRRDDIINILKTSFDFTDKEANEISNQMPQILDKLNKDGYILFDLDRFNRDNEKFQGAAFKHYIITFEGEVFNQMGGYQKQTEITLSAERIKNNREKLLVYGTLAVAIGALALVAWEMIRYFYLEKH